MLTREVSLKMQSMDDFLETYAVRRRKGATTLLYVLCWALIFALALAAAIALSGVMGASESGGLTVSWLNLLATLVLGGLAFLLWRGSDHLRVEYDYTFTNGILDVSRVLNNKRRRYLTALEMKNVIRCGPAAGPAFMKTLNEPGIKKHNWFVNRDANLYFFYFQKNGVKHVIVLELVKDMIAMIRSRNYLPRDAWYEADGSQKYGASIS